MTSTLNIEKNIPIPGPQRKRWPFSAMTSGDSVLVDNEEGFDRAWLAARKAASRKKLRCICRKSAEGMRIWFE